MEGPSIDEGRRAIRIGSPGLIAALAAASAHELAFYDLAAEASVERMREAEDERILNELLSQPLTAGRLPGGMKHSGNNRGHHRENQKAQRRARKVARKHRK